MSNDLLLQILNELKELKSGQAKLEEGQAKLEASLAKLEAGQQEIRRELSHIWSDIKRLDKRLTQQEQETYILKRMK